LSDSPCKDSLVEATEQPATSKLTPIPRNVARVNAIMILSPMDGSE
jgi:hypothetical protein